MVSVFWWTTAAFIHFAWLSNRLEDFQGSSLQLWWERIEPMHLYLSINTKTWISVCEWGGLRSLKRLHITCPDLLMWKGKPHNSLTHHGLFCRSICYRRETELSIIHSSHRHFKFFFNQPHEPMAAHYLSTVHRKCFLISDHAKPLNAPCNISHRSS